MRRVSNVLRAAASPSRPIVRITPFITSSASSAPRIAFLVTPVSQGRRHMSGTSGGPGHAVTAASKGYFEAQEMIAPHKVQLMKHPLYSAVTTIEELRPFMETHVYAVWDFMSLLKSLQHRFAPAASLTPWVPPKSGLAARMMNEIVLGEESDSFDELEKLTGLKHISHGELYVRSMEEVEADTTGFSKLIANVKANRPAFSDMKVDPRVSGFVNHTLECAGPKSGDHIVASAFLFGREDPIPDMFRRVLEALPAGKGAPLLRAYMLRHIEVDEGDHGPMAQRLMEEICGADKQKWREVGEVGVACVKQRIQLWDAALDAVKARKRLPAGSKPAKAYESALPAETKIGHVQRTWALVSGNVDAVAQGFHARLAAIDPPTATKLFAGIDVTKEGKQIVEIISAAVSKLRDVNAVAPAARSAARSSFGTIAPQNFGAVASALQHTLEHTLGPKTFTPDVHDSWVWASDLIADSIKSRK